MITQLTIYLVLVIAAFSLAIILKRSFEEVIPLVFMGIVFLMFLAGMVGQLSIGVYAVFLCLFFLWGLAIKCMRKEDCISTAIGYLMTPAFFIFTFIFACLTIFNIRRVPYTWDEYSVWASSVKIMTLWDQFGTVKEAKLLAAAYPPGMACFQYFVQKINILLRNSEFSEWRLYFAYQLFVYSMLMPFLRGLRHRKVYDSILSMAIVIIAPLFCLEHLFWSVYIDTFLSVLFGVGMAFVCFWDHMDRYYTIMTAFIMAILVLSKAAGLFLAIIVALCLILRIYKNKVVHGKKDDKIYRKMLPHLGIIIGSIGIPHLLWQINVKLSGCHIILTKKIDWLDFLKVLFGKSSSAHMEIFRAFIANLGEPVFSLKNLNISITLPGMAILICVFLFIAAGLVKDKFPGADVQIKREKLVGILLVGLFIYTIGMLLMYIYKIPDSSLPSYGRYMGIYLLGITVCGICGFLLIYPKRITNTGIEMVLALCLIVLGPQNDLADFVAFKYQNATLASRSKYVDLVNRYQAIRGGRYERVFLLNQEDDADPYWNLYFCLLPSVIENNANFPEENGEWGA